MRQRSPIAAGLRLVQKIPFILGLLLLWAGLLLLLLVFATAGMNNSALDGWGLPRAVLRGELLPATLGALVLTVAGFLLAQMRPGESPTALTIDVQRRSGEDLVRNASTVAIHAQAGDAVGGDRGDRFFHRFGNLGSVSAAQQDG